MKLMEMSKEERDAMDRDEFIKVLTEDILGAENIAPDDATPEQLRRTLAVSAVAAHVAIERTQELECENKKLKETIIALSMLLAGSLSA